MIRSGPFKFSWPRNEMKKLGPPISVNLGWRRRRRRSYKVYSGKLLSEKTFANFEVLWLFAQVLSTKFGGVASFGGSSKQKFSPEKSFFHQFTKVFPVKVSSYTVY